MNAIKPGTFKVSNFSSSNGSLSERIYDLNGEIVHEKTESGIKKTKSIGTIDYTTGSVELYFTFIQASNYATFICEPLNENVYMKTNNIIQLGNVSLTEIQND